MFTHQQLTMQELTMQQLTMQQLTMQQLTMQELPPMYRLDYLETSKRCSEDEPPPYISPPPYTIQVQAQAQQTQAQQTQAQQTQAQQTQAQCVQAQAQQTQAQQIQLQAQRVKVQRIQVQSQSQRLQVQRLQAQVQRLQARQKPNPFCCCYRKPIKDARCCGVCYTFCYEHNMNNRRLECCPASFEEYCVSGYIITTSGGVYEDDLCCCTLTCLPCKLVMFFPCFLGTSFNHLINCCRKTQTNYLF